MPDISNYFLKYMVWTNPFHFVAGYFSSFYWQAYDHFFLKLDSRESDCHSINIVNLYFHDSFTHISTSLATITLSPSLAIIARHLIIFIFKLDLIFRLTFLLAQFLWSRRLFFSVLPWHWVWCSPGLTCGIPLTPQWQLPWQSRILFPW